MQNKMKEYLGKKYTDNYVNNFLNYWMMPAVPRETNDLDCIYLNGDLNADTLMSAWTPMKWVLKILNPDEKFYKVDKNGGDRNSYLKKLQKNIDTYLPNEDELVILLYDFLRLAETRANVIRLPDRAMNCERYEKFFDEVPATIYHVFEGGLLHKYFQTDENVKKWIRNEKLQMIFTHEIEKANIRPLIACLPVKEAKWLSTREEVKEALEEMIFILSKRLEIFEHEEMAACCKC